MVRNYRIIKHTIPIYNIDLYIGLGDYKELLKKYGAPENLANTTNALSIRLADSKGLAVLFDNVREDIIAHECIHLKNYIFDNIGYEVTLNDEAEAYLTQYLFRIIYKYIKKWLVQS